MLKTLLAWAAAASLVGGAAGDIINVPGDYPTIQAAINVAAYGDEVVVAPGTYNEHINFLGNVITVRSSDGPEVTTIHGTGSGTIVLCISGEGPDTVLDGFTIRGAGGNQYGGGMRNEAHPTVANCIFFGNAAQFGGGMYNGASSPTVIKCVFQNNTASWGGGGIYNHLGSPTIIDCTFSQNIALQGGGVGNLSAGPTVTGCLFSGNVATDQHAGGGGMQVSGLAKVTDCVFAGNVAVEGGALWISEHPLIDGCLFMDNTASFGGAVHGESVFSHGRLTNCLFDGNTASVAGGAMFSSLSNPTLVNCTFNGNSAPSGGAVHAVNSGAELANCIIWGNSPEQIFNGPGPVLAVTYSDVQGGWPGAGNIDADPQFADPGNGDYRPSPGSPCVDAGNDAEIPADSLDLDGDGDTAEPTPFDLDENPRAVEDPDTPDCQQVPGQCGQLPVVDMGAYEYQGGGCLAILSEEIECHADGSTFTLTIGGVNACTGALMSATFTASGGAPGEELCFTLLVAGQEGGFCCSGEVCVVVPDCSLPAGDLDGDGVVGVTDLLDLLAAWGPCGACDCPQDLDGDLQVGVTDALLLLASWG